MEDSEPETDDSTEKDSTEDVSAGQSAPKSQTTKVQPSTSRRLKSLTRLSPKRS
ncbi:MAG: hypothetical protein CM15mP116_09710 [Synechococcus sp.]|nr:MAG: hypothetical protein CM15mP116_09710 [Synechococcus sp.]